jgi:fluoride exporter
MIFLIGLGGVTGTLLRYYLGRWITARTNAIRFPLGTWTINATGSWLLGVLFALHQHHASPDWVWLVVGTGFCGGYTTFSTFGYETWQLVHTGARKRALLYVVASVLFGLLFAWLGMQTGH